VRTFKELMRYVLTVIDRRRLLLDIPYPIAKLQAAFLQFLPKPLLTPDQVELLKTDNVVSAAAERDRRTFTGLGIEPVAMESIVPSYLWRFRKTGQFKTSRFA
jgi:NADH dehydrogenase